MKKFEALILSLLALVGTGSESHAEAGFSQETRPADSEIQFRFHDVEFAEYEYHHRYGRPYRGPINDFSSAD